jgi:VanZ family protein
MRMSYFVKYQLPMLLYMLLIFCISSSSKISAPDFGFQPQDKLYHFLFYTIFGYLIGRAFYYQKKSPFLHINYFVLGIIFGAVYALSDEFHQNFVIGRVMSIGDFIADTLGVIAGIFIYKLRLVKKLRGQENSGNEDF